MAKPGPAAASKTASQGSQRSDSATLTSSEPGESAPCTGCTRPASTIAGILPPREPIMASFIELARQPQLGLILAGPVGLWRFRRLDAASCGDLGREAQAEQVYVGREDDLVPPAVKPDCRVSPLNRVHGHGQARRMPDIAHPR